MKTTSTKHYLLLQLFGVYFAGITTAMAQMCPPLSDSPNCETFGTMDVCNNATFAPSDDKIRGNLYKGCEWVVEATVVTCDRNLAKQIGCSEGAKIMSKRGSCKVMPYKKWLRECGLSPAQAPGNQPAQAPSNQ